MITWKIIALITEINPFFLMTGPDTTIFEQPALLIPATMTVFRCEIIKHLFEIGIFFKDRVAKQCFKTFCIDVEVAQFFFQLDTQTFDIPINMGKTRFTAQPARGNAFFYGIVCHGVPPS